MTWIVVGGFAVEPIVLVLALALVAGGLLWWDGRRTVAPTTSARRGIRHATITFAVALTPLVVGMASPVLVFYFGLLAPRLEPRLLAIAPTIGLWAFLAVQTVGELTWPGPRGSHREARLVARTASDVVGHAARRWMWATVAVLAAAGGALALAADGPRTIARLADGAVAAQTSFPGWSWTIPVLAVAMVAAGATEAVLRLVASRPAVEGVDGYWDMWLRRRAARRLVRVTQLVLGLTLAGLVGLAGLSLRWLGLAVMAGEAPAVGSSVHVLVGDVLCGIAIAAVAASLVAAAWPARDPAPQSTIGQVPAGARS
ncbi:hypothetical protein [Krasilnikoviella flava]|uniref:Uncharacterized protein n=1 Tax=Krasilnikoviella flava TaxID=526729 RepID=A0A1T5K671_9MICO|nr:hypothetical protein [Krasilnikoviella flava]SKC59123.1 hypothetical protein SAMN04324258_1863 [Krasilnikoviella flava]